MYSKDLRPSEHGFADLKSLLNSTEMQGQGGVICRGGRYFAAGDENTAKILELVRHTKPKKKSRPLKAAVAGGGCIFTCLYLCTILVNFLLSLNRMEGCLL